MHDQRIEKRAFLSCEDLRHGTRIERIGTQTVDGFRGEGDQPTTPENRSGSGRDGVRVGR